MDSPPPEQPSVDSVTHDLRNQSLAADAAPPPRAKLKLEDLNWDNSFVRELPGDPRTDTFPREVLHAFFTKVTPSAEVDDPQLVAWTQSVAESLELDPQDIWDDPFVASRHLLERIIEGRQKAREL